MPNLIGYVQPGSPTLRADTRELVLHYLVDYIGRNVNWQRAYYPRAYLHAPNAWIALLQEAFVQAFRDAQDRRYIPESYQPEFLPWPLEPQRYPSEWLEPAAFSRIVIPGSVGVFLPRAATPANQNADDAVAVPAAHWTARLLRHMGPKLYLLPQDPAWFVARPARPARRPAMPAALVDVIGQVGRLIVNHARTVHVQRQWFIGMGQWPQFRYQGTNASVVHRRAWERLVPSIPLHHPFGDVYEVPEFGTLPADSVQWPAMSNTHPFMTLLMYGVPASVAYRDRLATWRQWTGRGDSSRPINVTRTTRQISTTSPLVRGHYTLTDGGEYCAYLLSSGELTLSGEQHSHIHPAELVAVLIWRLEHRLFRLAIAMYGGADWVHPVLGNPNLGSRRLFETLLSAAYQIDQIRYTWHNWIRTLFWDHSRSLDEGELHSRLQHIGPTHLAHLVCANRRLDQFLAAMSSNHATEEELISYLVVDCPSVTLRGTITSDPLPTALLARSPTGRLTRRGQIVVTDPV